LFRGSIKSTDLTSALHFGAVVKQKLDSAATSSDALAQLAALLQQGTPIATVVDRIAKQLADSAARAFPKPLDADARIKLQQAFANALAPPGTGPPGTSGDQASALAQRLRKLLGTLAGEAESAGQQSRFSGKILDATAKELPAQQTKTHADLPSAAIASFVESLLGNVAAQLQTSTSISPSPATPAQQAPALPIPAQNLLERIIARAVRADTYVNGPSSSSPARAVAAASSIPSTRITQPASAAATTHAAATPSALFARLLAVIATANTGGRQAFADGQSHAAPDDRSLPAANVTGVPGKTDGATSFGAQNVANPNANPATASAQPASPTPYTTLDAQAVIDQVVKGIVTRNFGDSSEVRMRLSPEHLGDVSLKLTVQGGTINATMIAQNADVRDTLLANQHQLARSLAEAGLALGSFSVDVSGNNANGSDKRQQQPAFGTAHGRFGHLLDVDGAEQWIEPRYGPPVLSGNHNPWLLNTLA
jgi:flagellar hook-length control protein FliK